MSATAATRRNQRRTASSSVSRSSRATPRGPAWGWWEGRAREPPGAESWGGGGGAPLQRPGCRVVLAPTSLPRDGQACAANLRLAWRSPRDVAEEPLDLFAIERLAEHEELGQLVEPGAVLGEDLECDVVGFIDQAANLLVDLEGDGVGVIGRGTPIAAEEHLALLLTEGAGADQLGHAVLGDPLSSDL